jgi:hypothetical protein
LVFPVERIVMKEMNLSGCHLGRVKKYRQRCSRPLAAFRAHSNRYPLRDMASHHVLRVVRAHVLLRTLHPPGFPIRDASGKSRPSL